ncbi:MAG: hypothetical protein JEZ07_06385 [Phycisphaerae bacterium]|nr:hypothetical protein [Phycisphaerae bacterium]
MKKIIFNVLCVLGIIISVVMMGCSSFVDHVTPAWPDKAAVDYVTSPIVAGDDAYADKDDLKTRPAMPFMTLADVKKQRLLIDYKHEDTQQVFMDAIRDDKVAYGRNVNSTDRTIADSQSLQDNFVNGFEGIGGPALIGMLSVGGLAWNRRKPGDIAKADADKAQQDAIEKATAEAKPYQDAFAETVKGVQDFIDSELSATMADSLKRSLANKQSPATKKLVAVTKVTA